MFNTNRQIDVKHEQIFNIFLFSVLFLTLLQEFDRDPLDDEAVPASDDDTDIDLLEAHGLVLR